MKKVQERRLRLRGFVIRRDKDYVGGLWESK